ncbi:hypothetical protein KUL42_22620 [Alteromonas sp. KUL42]|uniref:TniQ family protein n=1 Tax=Alteromonas sp. KUL42 TaxID=2480797 RepID=UPI001035C51E|nr:TniQ family protein [Alteromonas sp. KUL42]TAP34756.1 hypothetical protein EYR97_11145 [Alteromonas sp. KUL42]GEA07501.1 hypothetical protein KUL42_22620 [Alteromonas sp. KUL42]
MIDQKLLCRPTPEVDESFQSYVERLAFYNHVKPQDLLLFSQAKLKYPATSREQKLSILTLLSELTEYSESEDLFDIRLVPKEYKTLFDFDFKKVCQKCLYDRAYFRDIWSLKNYVVCAEHRTPLSSHCLSCGKMFSFESAFLKKCDGCNSHFRGTSNAQSVYDPISEYIFKVFDGSDSALKEITKKIKQLQPYIRLINNGRFENIESLRKGNLTGFARLQASSAELMLDNDKSVEAFSKYLASKVNKNEWSKALNGFRDVTSNPSEYEFADVMKRTILERTGDIGDGAISYDLLAKIWKLDASKLTLAIQESVPDEVLIKTGRHKIRCSDFTNYWEHILAAYSDLG